MTDEYRGSGGAVGPPWSVDVLADLHAGALDEREAAELWPRVNADPEARAIIEALEVTTSDLSALSSAPVEPMPADVAARIDAALAEEHTRRGSNVVSMDAARKRRNRRAGWGAGFLAAAAAVVAAVVIVVPDSTNDETGGTAQPAPSSGKPAMAFRGDELGSAFGKIDGLRDYGPLQNEQRLDACLEANDINPDLKPVGFTPATIDGQESVIVLYTTGKLAQYRLVALAPDCGPDNPGLLRDQIIGKGS